ncbi:EpsG family protein [Photobacterium damselae]|uniref:EpsG family protein n=1 Tax=Photobacterium damselae TaxID=38293 RepID=UPI004069824C
MSLKFSFVILFLVVYQINFAYLGNDYLSYEIHYDFLSRFYNFESGYEYLVKFSKSLGIPFFYFYTSVNLIGLLLYFYYFHKESGDKGYKIIVVFPFVCFMFFSLHINAIRQSIAVIIILYSLRFIYGKEKYNLIFFVFFVFFASEFHRSAYIGLIFPIIYLLSSFRKDYFIVFFLVSTILYILKIDITVLFLNDIMIYFNSTIHGKFEFYDSVAKESYFGIGFFDRIFIFLLAVFIRYKVLFSFEDCRLKFLYAVIISYVSLQMFLFNYNIIMQRVKFYFIPILFLYWVIAICNAKSINQKIILILLLLFYSISNFFIRYSHL